jgi:hypothetical protein
MILGAREFMKQPVMWSMKDDLFQLDSIVGLSVSTLGAHSPQNAIVFLLEKNLKSRENTEEEEKVKENAIWQRSL